MASLVFYDDISNLFSKQTRFESNTYKAKNTACERIILILFMHWIGNIKIYTE